jgi:hypothetical protein
MTNAKFYRPLFSWSVERDECDSSLLSLLLHLDVVEGGRRGRHESGAGHLPQGQRGQEAARGRRELSHLSGDSGARFTNV